MPKPAPSRPKKRNSSVESNTLTTPKPAHSLTEPDTRVYVGDSRELLRTIPECVGGQIDMIYADPPFNWSREYDRVERVTGKTVEGNRVWDDAIPDEDYLRFTFDWLDGCIAALKPEGTLWVNIPDTWAAEIACYLKGFELLGRRVAKPLTMVNWCIWHYRFGQNREGNFINSKVHVFYFCKSIARRTWNPDPILEPSDRATIYGDERTFNKKEGKSGLRVPMDVWYGKYWGRIQGNNKERRHGHDNQIPEVYLERVIRATTNEGDLILDPFLGSGTTCTVARELGRRSIGLEFSKANAASAFKRIAEGPFRVSRDAPTIHVNPIFKQRSASRNGRDTAGDDE